LPLFKVNKPQVSDPDWTPVPLPPPLKRVKKADGAEGAEWDEMKCPHLSRVSEAMFTQTPLIPFIPLMRVPSPVTGNSYFFKKLKHKKAVKKLQTDLAIAKQEAAITVLELNEKIMTLCEGRPFPRGQYYHVTGAHWPLFLGDAYRLFGSKAKRQVLCLA
jgi:hypothetical protein